MRSPRCVAFPAARIVIAIMSVAGITGLSGCLDSGADTTSEPETNNDGTPQNRAPQISGTPTSAASVGASWSFTPTASDPDADALVFEIENQPSWTNFDASTGELSGTPTSGNVGVFSNITISVSDNLLNAALPAFSIEVTDVALGMATVSWTLPTIYDDGSALGNLQGVNIYYGNSPGDLPNTIEIAGVNASSYVVEGLPPATYYFTVSVVDSAGVESGPSPVASVTVE